MKISVSTFLCLLLLSCDSEEDPIVGMPPDKYLLSPHKYTDIPPGKYLFPYIFTKEEFAYREKLKKELEEEGFEVIETEESKYFSDKYGTLLEVKEDGTYTIRRIE